MAVKRVTCATLALLLAPGLALADATTEAELRAALQNATNQIATLEDQVAHLQAAQAPLTAANASLMAQLAAQKPAPAPTGPKADDTKVNDAALATANRRLASQAAALARGQAALQQATGTASTTAAANATLNRQLANAHQTITGCNAHNAALYNLANQILDAYAHKDDVFGTIANREPFIGFKRVQLQNIVQDDQDKLDANQINP